MKKYQELMICIEKFEYKDVMGISLQQGYEDNELPRVDL